MNTITSKLLLLAGLLNGERAYNGPFYADIDLTDRCNLRCMGCPYHSPVIPEEGKVKTAQRDISFEFAARIFNELWDSGCRELILQGGGEPLLHPRFLDILYAAKKKGFRVVVLTNGTLLTPEISEAIADSGLDILKLSLWATSLEQYGELYPGSDPGNFERVLASLRLLKELRSRNNSRTPKLHIQYPITNLNHADISRAAEIARDNGCDGINYSPLSTIKDQLVSYQLNDDQIKQTINMFRLLWPRLNDWGLDHNLDTALLRFELGHRPWESSPCFAGWYHTRIRANGRVYPCGLCFFDFGSLHDKSFKEIWNGRAIRDFRRQTISKEGLIALIESERADCNFCGFYGDNSKVNTIFRWLYPAARLSHGRNRSIGIDK